VRVVFDPTYPTVDMHDFIKTGWKPPYGDTHEDVPPNAPFTHGKAVDLHPFVDSDHAGDKFRWRSRTGFVIYLNMVPIAWFPEQQSMMESNVFLGLSLLQ
jgi:hypothetical protein